MDCKIEAVPIFITGAAGFIGYHLALRLLSKGYAVHGMDNLNAYYEVALKKERLKRFPIILVFPLQKGISVTRTPWKGSLRSCPPKLS